MSDGHLTRLTWSNRPADPMWMHQSPIEITRTDPPHPPPAQSWLAGLFGRLFNV
jgi:hypothetical protein